MPFDRIVFLCFLFVFSHFLIFILVSSDFEKGMTERERGLGGKGGTIERQTERERGRGCVCTVCPVCCSFCNTEGKMDQRVGRGGK